MKSSTKTRKPSRKVSAKTTNGEPVEFVIQQTEFDAFFFALAETEDTALLTKMFYRAYSLLNPFQKNDETDFFFAFLHKNAEVLGVDKKKLASKVLGLVEANEDYELAAYLSAQFSKINGHQL